MNPLPPNADELVSAYLDGEAAPDEIAVVESSPELLARVESMRALSGQLRAPLSPPAAQKEAHLASALGAFDAMFADAPTTETASPETLVPESAAPTLASVPASAVPPPTAPLAAQASTPVVSLEAARERRRPRRFNTGVIAAAVAALCLFVGLAVLSAGRSDDVADSSAFDSSSTASAESSDASDADDGASSGATADDAIEEGAADDEAMDDDDAMSDDAMESDAAASITQAAPNAVVQATPAPAPSAEPPSADAAMEEDAAGDDAMEDEAALSDEAMSDDAMDEEAAEESPLELRDTEFFLGDHTDEEDLLAAITSLDPDEFEARLDVARQLLFPRCEDLIGELTAGDPDTLVGEATLNGSDVEVHQVIVEDQATIYIVDPNDCTIVASSP